MTFISYMHIKRIFIIALFFCLLIAQRAHFLFIENNTLDMFQSSFIEASVNKAISGID